MSFSTLTCALLVFSPWHTTELLGDDSAAGLLHRDDVQGELKVTPRQHKKWEELDPQPKYKRVDTFAPDDLVLLDPETVEKKDAEREKKAWSLLGPGQVVRLRELVIQRAGLNAALRDDVKWALDLTDGQAVSIRRAKTAHDATIRDMIQQSKVRKLDPKRVVDVLAKAEQELLEDLGGILTPEQTQKLAEMGGKPFKFMDRVFK